MNDLIMKIKGREQRRAIRTVYAGTVQINGVTYYPPQPYNGELDGLRCVFGLYRTGDYYSPFVSLWGTEKESRTGEIETNPPYVKDGYLAWMFWHASPAFMQSLVDDTRYDDGYRHLIRVRLELDKVGV